MVKTALCHQLGMELPLFAFTRSREVVVEVGKAGGCGVLGAISYTPEELDEQLNWIDAHIDGKPYGVDTVIPQNYEGRDLPKLDRAHMESLISQKHKDFIEKLLESHGVGSLPKEGFERPDDLLSWNLQTGVAQVEVALEHPVKIIANALGTPPQEAIEMAHKKNVLMAALCGKKKQALAHKKAGVDVVIAQGWEAGGHTGEIAGMILCPEIVDAVGDTPVLMAGGIGTGRHIAAALSLGAQGVWTGSIWLTTAENQAYQSKASTELLLEATSADTKRSRAISGKPARQLRTGWVKAWEGEESPGFLPLPLQWLAQGEAMARINYHNIKELLTVPAGQIVGRMNEIRPVREVISQMATELHETLDKLNAYKDPS